MYQLIPYFSENAILKFTKYSLVVKSNGGSSVPRVIIVFLLNIMFFIFHFLWFQCLCYRLNFLFNSSLLLFFLLFFSFSFFFSILFWNIGFIQVLSLIPEEITSCSVASLHILFWKVIFTFYT